MNSSYLAEFIGTFVFLFIILQSGSFGTTQPFVIVAGLLAAILMMGSYSGGHFNPAVTAMMHAKGSPEVASVTNAVMYVVAQVLGGLVALNVKRIL